MSRTVAYEKPGSSPPGAVDDRPRPVPLVVLSAWCGLVAGLAEVGAILVRKRTVDLNHLYWMSRHFVWLVPLVNLAIFLVLGLIISTVAFRGRRGRWLAPRLVVGMAWLPVVWAALPRVYGAAGCLLAIGLAARTVPLMERRAGGLRRLVRISSPVLAGLVAILAASALAPDRLRAWREASRPLPPPGAANVLLIVLDTVGADHLRLCGYERPTSTAIEELAGRGIRFDRAQAAASWTLPSHASLFTGRWPHELSAGWFTPLDGACPTLAEFLEGQGYATAGFIANSWYCGTDSGLARGFATYRDYSFPRLTALATTSLIDRPLMGIEAVEDFLEERLGLDIFRPAVERLWWLFKSDRKGAAEVNREFLDWLAARRPAGRPFFAFLNYYDAHAPYQVSEWGIHRFGTPPRNAEESAWIRDWLRLLHRNPSPHQVDFERDAYDDCVAGLDEEIGWLCDELGRWGDLDRTWVIITADHGESFGEQPGVFWHGTSLYQPQLHVPLVIVPPAGGPSPRVVAETVSLRDLAATIADVLGFGADSPFPGVSLARHWAGSSGAAPAPAEASASALSEVIPLGATDPDPAQWLLKPRWPLASLTEGDWTYIRRPEDGREELFHLPGDARQRQNLAADPAARPTLERMRNALDRLTDGPLTPQRFNP
jgi:arylsulfatase A-like enzyme